MKKIPSAVETGPGQEEKKIGGKIPFSVLIIVILKHRNNGSLHDYIRRILVDIFGEIQGDLRGKTNPVTGPTVHGIRKHQRQVRSETLLEG